MVSSVFIWAFVGNGTRKAVYSIMVEDTKSDIFLLTGKQKSDTIALKIKITLKELVMRVKLGREFETLYAQYENSREPEDRVISMRLKAIVDYYMECEPEEATFAHEITEAFSSLILLLQEQHEKTLQQADCTPVAYSNTMAWLGNRQQDVYYEPVEDLVRDFYNYFKKEEEVDYLDIDLALVSGKKELVNPTMKDYVARIYTFAKKYLHEMYTPQELGNMHPVLFTYYHIEQILATFKTRDAQGEIIKQRVNIRSALRKLNQFKQAQK